MTKKPTYHPVNKSKAENISTSGSPSPNMTVGFEDIDSAIKYYFDNVVHPFVIEDGAQVPVPVIMGSPERWQSVQKDGYYRDKNGLLTCPLIMFKCTGADKNRALTRNIDANNPQIYQSFERSYSSRNKYDAFSILTNTKPQREIYNVVVPDYMTINYECIIWADYITQLNKIKEAINYAESSYWGDSSKFNFYAVVNGFTDATDVSDSTERIVRTNFNLTIHGYLISDALQKEILHRNKREFSICKIKFNNELVTSITPTGVAVNSTTEDINSRDESEYSIDYYEPDAGE